MLNYSAATNVNRYNHTISEKDIVINQIYIHITDYGNKTKTIQINKSPCSDIQLFNRIVRFYMSNKVNDARIEKHSDNWITANI